MKRCNVVKWSFVVLTAMSPVSKAYDCLEQSPGFMSDPEEYYSPTLYSPTPGERKQLEKLFELLSRGNWQGGITDTICLDQDDRVSQGDASLTFENRAGGGGVLRFEHEYKSQGKSRIEVIELADRRSLNHLAVNKGSLEIIDRYRRSNASGSSVPIEQITEIHLSGPVIDLTVNYFTRGILTGKQVYKLKRR